MKGTSSALKSSATTGALKVNIPPFFAGIVSKSTLARLKSDCSSTDRAAIETFVEGILVYLLAILLFAPKPEPRYVMGLRDILILESEDLLADEFAWMRFNILACMNRLSLDPTLY